ncbi:MAG: TetR/AcrR family transcriptional regulator [Chloroflexota bacterium]
MANQSQPTESPRQRRAARTREAIIDAARSIITEQGAYNLSLREVARRIDYSPAGLYEYFSGKDELIMAVIQDGFTRFGQYLLSVPADLPADAYLLEIGLAYIRFAKQNPEHFMLIFNTKDLYKPQSQEHLIASETFKVLLVGVERNIEVGHIAKHHDHEEVAYGLWSLVHGMATLYITQLEDFDRDWEAATERMLRTFTSGLQ